MKCSNSFCYEYNCVGCVKRFGMTRRVKSGGTTKMRLVCTDCDEAAFSAKVADMVR